MNLSSFGRRLLAAADGATLGLIAGLGTAAYKNTGTSGNTVPLLDGANTWSAIQTFSANPSVTGGAISFPATQVPSAGANDLDDYEEGTFTPTIVGSTTAGVGTYVTQAGIYTKVGNLVKIEITLNWTAHTGTGNIIIGGLPFTVGASSSGAMPIAWSTLSFTGQGVNVFPSAGTAQLQMRDLPATTAARANIAIDTSAFLIIGGSYTV